LKAIHHLLELLNPFRLIRLVRYLFFRLGEFRRSFAKFDYVLFLLEGTYPSLPLRRSWLQRRLFGAPPVSLWDLDRTFQRIADDPRPKGIILHVRTLQMPLADLQTLRGMLLRIRDRGKRVICFAQDYDNTAYFIASAADEVILQPGGMVEVTGLRRQAMFLKDALTSVGIGMDVVAISPFKSGADQFSRSEPSPESNAQMNWLLDAEFGIITEALAEGRKQSVEAIRRLIDDAPYTDEGAVKAGLIDTRLSEEALPAHLGAKTILTANQAQKKLFRKWQKRASHVVAVLHLRGTMISGESSAPPLPFPVPIPFIGGHRMGDLTVVKQVRALLKNKRVAALVIQIDSSGGSASASEAMAAALDVLAKTRPIVAYFNSVAASGGYYIATSAEYIIAQPGTITGSIGVFTSKPLNSSFFEKLRVNAVEYRRGANAGINSDGRSYTEVQRAKLQEIILAVYQLFIERVARARHTTPEAIGPVCEGRVWLGVQAKAHGLIDELGNLHTALNKARALAGLPEDAPAMLVRGTHSEQPPTLTAQPVAALNYLKYVHENWGMLASGMPQMLLPLEWK